MTDTGTSHPTIRREARLVGLDRDALPTLEAVERRRTHLWIATVIMLAALAAATVIATLWDQSVPLLSPRVLRFAVLGLTVGFCAYAMEKEMHFRRLSKLLVDERVLSASLAGRVRELSSLLDAGRAMNSVLELEAVLDVILGSSIDLLDGADGSIMLLDESYGTLHAVAVRGRDGVAGAVVRVGEGIAGGVAQRREPMLIQGRVARSDDDGSARPDSAMSVPLVSREMLLGVLNINAGPERVFTEYDLRALSLFAEQAAAAVANSRLYEAQRDSLAEAQELDHLKSELFTSLSHELRTPLTSILGSAVTLRRPDLRPDDRDGLLEGLERQSRRLADTIDGLLSVAHPGSRIGDADDASVVDAASLARLIAADFSKAGRPVTVDAPAHVPLRVGWESLRRVLTGLTDNAFLHGAPPVHIVLRPRGGSVEIGVLDAGRGVDPGDRDLFFDRFVSHRRSGDPSGLGLAVVRGMVHGMGGAIRVEESTLGGAAFWVTLPGVGVAPDADDTDAADHADAG